MSGVHDLRSNPSLCPSCGATLSGAGNAGNETTAPTAGDVTVCFYCAVELVFDENLRLRVITEADRAALSEIERAELAAAKGQTEAFLRATGHKPPRETRQ